MSNISFIKINIDIIDNTIFKKACFSERDHEKTKSIQNINKHVRSVRSLHKNKFYKV